MGGHCTIECPTTGYSSSIDFHCKVSGHLDCRGYAVTSLRDYFLDVISFLLHQLFSSMCGVSVTNVQCHCYGFFSPLWQPFYGGKRDRLTAELS